MSALQLHTPTSLQEASRLLAADPEARCLAGGATLVAMMNAGLVQPSALVSLRKIDGMAGITRHADGSVRIGAMTRHRATAISSDLKAGQTVVKQAASVIANPPVRNMGTMGGSIAFADPGADYPPALVAADAEIELVGGNGSRRIKAADFFIDWYQTALEPGELVAAIHLPAGNLQSIGHYDKLARVEGDYATASVAVVLTMAGQSCAGVAVAVGACGPKPVRLAEAEGKLVGSSLDDASLAAAGALLAEAADPVDDVRASADYRRLVIPRLVRRAVRAALTRAR
jgi:carbon-monoxide dehydrogenase medium subunit